MGGGGGREGKTCPGAIFFFSSPLPADEKKNNQPRTDDLFDKREQKQTTKLHSENSQNSVQKSNFVSTRSTTTTRCILGPDGFAAGKEKEGETFPSLFFICQTGVSNGGGRVHSARFSRRRTVEEERSARARVVREQKRGEHFLVCVVWATKKEIKRFSIFCRKKTLIIGFLQYFYS